MIIWLSPRNSHAVAMFYSIATANRALRKVESQGGVKVQSLKDATPSVQREALSGKMAKSLPKF